MLTNDPTTNLLWISSSGVVAVSVFSAAFPLFNAVLSPQDRNTDSWHLETQRWNQLCFSSQSFRTLERWIVGLSVIIESKMPWFIEVPIRRNFVGRLTLGLFILVFGDPKRTKTGTQICYSQQPWNPSELVASGFILASLISLAAMMLVFNSHSLWIVGCISAMVWIACYRYWIWRFTAKAYLRQREIRRFLPHAMDSVAMVTASGGTFELGIEKVVEDFPEHPLSIEFARLAQESARGLQLKDALAATAAGVCLPEFDEMARLLTRVDSHGISVDETFARLAKQLRNAHLRRMEEEVGRSEATMEFPTMLVLFSAMLVAVAPFALSIMKTDFMR